MSYNHKENSPIGEPLCEDRGVGTLIRYLKVFFTQTSLKP
jgi:hypothetical protein